MSVRRVRRSLASAVKSNRARTIAHRPGRASFSSAFGTCDPADRAHRPVATALTFRATPSIGRRNIQIDHSGAIAVETGAGVITF
jgi:hypothetical protein